MCRFYENYDMITRIGEDTREAERDELGCLNYVRGALFIGENWAENSCMEQAARFSQSGPVGNLKRSFRRSAASSFVGRPRFRPRLVLSKI